MLEKTLLHTIEKHKLIKKGDRILVATSGGVDSVVMLTVLNKLKKRLGIRLVVAHFNHLLRGASATRDERFVKRVAQRMKLPFVTGRGDVKKYARSNKLSIEEAARFMRYSFFVDACKKNKCQSCTLAHTKDDQVETVLMRLIHGTGVRGLAAIRHEIRYHSMRCIRPLLAIQKSEIITYARKKKIAYREDSTNASTKFLRNRVRHKLIPFLNKTFDTDVSTSLSRLSCSAQADMDFITAMTNQAFSKCLKQKKKGTIVFNRKKVLAYHPGLWFHIISKALAEINAQCPLEYEKWETVVAGLKQCRKCQIDLGNQCVFMSQYNDICLRVKQTQKEIKPHTLLIRGSLKWQSGGVIKASMIKKVPSLKHKKKNSEYVDAEKMGSPLLVRARRKGDTFQPLGMKGKKKLKDFFIDKKIPHHQRDRIPLVVCGSDIVWVVPYALSDKFKIRSSTKKFVKLSYHESS